MPSLSSRRNRGEPMMRNPSVQVVLVALLITVGCCLIVGLGLEAVATAARLESEFFRPELRPNQQEISIASSAPSMIGASK
jgi:hypothetical protein